VRRAAGLLGLWAGCPSAYPVNAGAGRMGVAARGPERAPSTLCGLVALSQDAPCVPYLRQAGMASIRGYAMGFRNELQ
jgi:hypothetical protein